MTSKLFPFDPSWLPKTDGFKFEALLRSGRVATGEILRGFDGMHTTKGVSFKDVARWRQIPGRTKQ